MTELKCPYCGEKLVRHWGMKEPALYCCDNPKCSRGGVATESAWQELIRTKEFLDIESSEHDLCHDALVERTKELDRTRKELEQSEICCTEWEKQALDYKAENIALSGDLERTRKALGVAKERLKNTILDAEILATPEYLASRAKETLAEITALEQKE